MQLTKFSDYSLRVLMYLATRRGGHTTIREISDAHEISENHLMKVVHNLGKLGYVKTVRGKGGGISLALASDQIVIGTVVRELEPLTPVECFAPDYDGACKLYPACGLRGALDDAQSAFLSSLDQYKLSDVINPKRRADAFRKGSTPSNYPQRR
jgi:Rrf2 family transcriptional regulator, nitric oxide-sensitive transcriptional repressor